MRANKLFKRLKAEKGSGRTVKIKHLLLPEEVVEDLKIFQDCYEICFSPKKDENGNPIPIRVTYEQMIRRWMDNISRIDPDVAKLFPIMKEQRKKEQERLAAGLGLTPEQLQKNEAAFDPTAPENEPWKLKYFFEKDGEEVDAIPYLGQPFFAGRLYYPFYVIIDGQNVGMSKMLADGWTLQNEIGEELDFEQASKLCTLIKEHQSMNK